MTQPRPHASRGQNLVLLALTMLFVTLMVTITLSLGVKLRQKHELQNLADAAAFSNAVAEARAFNNSALINRLQVSYWVAQAADQSLISYATYGREMIEGSAEGATQAASSCNNPLAIARLVAFSTAAKALDLAVAATWNGLDTAAGNESRAIQGAIAGLRDELRDDTHSRLLGVIGNQSLAKQVVDQSKVSDVKVVTPGGATASKRELNHGLVFERPMNDNMLDAAMGTRGSAFLTDRTQMPSVPALTAIAAATGVTLTFTGHGGSGYWNDITAPAMPHDREPVNTAAWGDDHGQVLVTAAPCFNLQQLWSLVQSTDIDNSDDSHDWAHKNPAEEPHGQEMSRHTMGSCNGSCPSVWVRTIGFKPDGEPINAFGQPKTLVVLERDLGTRKLPWELHFTFPFVNGTSNDSWDGRGLKLQSSVGSGLDISKQQAYATGVVYYHRFDHWEEVPNLLNPFWRATLVPSDVDAEGKDDVHNALAGSQAWQSKAWDELQRVGYRGIH
jgi:Putative Flp pilus-assembly TadE/G-like